MVSGLKKFTDPVSLLRFLDPLEGLTDAHRKLSDYYQTFDESPFYIWSSCMSNFILNQRLSLVSYCSLFAVLDPRISYDAMKDEFEDDPDLSGKINLNLSKKTRSKLNCFE